MRRPLSFTETGAPGKNAETGRKRPAPPVPGPPAAEEAGEKNPVGKRLWAGICAAAARMAPTIVGDAYSRTPVNSLMRDRFKDIFLSMDSKTAKKPLSNIIILYSGTMQGLIHTMYRVNKSPIKETRLA